MKILKKILTLILIQALVRAGPPKDDCCKQQNWNFGRCCCYDVNKQRIIANTKEMFYLCQSFGKCDHEKNRWAC